MKDVTSYDGDLAMFRETPKPVHVTHLEFMRWLVEHGRLEHRPAGPPGGQFTMKDVEPILAEVT
jgi:hypothetical protein